MPSWDDDYWLLLLIEGVTGCPVESLDSCGWGTRQLCLNVNGVYHNIPIEDFRHSPRSETILRWFHSLNKNVA